MGAEVVMRFTRFHTYRITPGDVMRADGEVWINPEYVSAVCSVPERKDAARIYFTDGRAIVSPALVKMSPLKALHRLCDEDSEDDDALNHVKHILGDES